MDHTKNLSFLTSTTHSSHLTVYTYNGDKAAANWMAVVMVVVVVSVALFKAVPL